jgi:predicted nucleic acid-binding protein
MSVSPFFDTTILIYSIWETNERAAVAEEIIAAGGHINVQVLNEFASVARRKLKMPWWEISESLDSIRRLCQPVTPLTVRVHEAALKIAADSGYNIYDALIIAAAIDAGCDILYSEDMQDGQRIGPLTIRNPFV